MGRIVAITETDLISMYYLIATALNSGSTVTALAANSSGNAVGQFAVSANGIYVAKEPVANLAIATATAATVYFVPSYDFAGITLSGVAVDVSDVVADGHSLYKAVLADGAVTITKVSL